MLRYIWHRKYSLPTFILYWDLHSVFWPIPPPSERKCIISVNLNITVLLPVPKLWWSNPSYLTTICTRILNPFSLLNRETSSATNKLTQNKDLRTIQQILTSTALLGVYLSTLSSIQSKRNRFVFLFILLLWHISCTKH
jgi:hypothetical protein